MEEVEEGSGTNSELSGTSSSSSVFNAAADDATASVFSLFPSGKFVTRQLFPMGDVAVEVRERQVELLRVGSSQPTNNTNQQWLNLAVSSSGSVSGLGSGSGSGSVPEQQQVRRSRRGPRSRSSQYRGVTFYRRTGRWESHIWDCGKQVYLGGFDTAHAAARAYDRAAIKFRGVDADINFNVADYDDDMNQMKNLTKEEFVQILRRQSTGFSRGSSRYRGVNLHKCARLDARMAQFLGNKASDKAAIQCNGREAITNFEPLSYQGQIPIQANNGVDGHDLDLNLGISVTIDGPKASYNMGSVESQTHHSHLQLANGKMPMNGSTTYSPQDMKTLYGQPLASRQPNITWSEAYEDKIGNEKIEANSSARSLSNWAWYTQSHGHGGGGGGGATTTSQVQVSSCTAASSGFSISTISPPSTAFPLFTNSQTHVLPSSPPTSNSFHHYAWPG